MTEKLISIIICTRNRAAVLDRVLTLHLVLALPNGWKREYVIVDNGSSDSTKEVVDRFRHEASFRVQYAYEPQAGHSIALNTGCRTASGEILAFTDDDAIPVNDWLVEIIQSIASEGNDWVYGPVSPRWEYGKPPVWFGPRTAPWLACLNYGDSPFLATESNTSFAGVNHACKAKRLQELNYYDTEKGLQGNGESYAGNDDDLYNKGLAKGWRLYYNPNMSVEHIIDPKRYRLLAHIRNIWLLGRNECRNRFRKSLASNENREPIIPRYRFGLCCRHFLYLIKSLVSFSIPNSIYYFSQILRFFSSLVTATKYAIGWIR
jgi:glycosyltransferase involved in cell wall biosynthesis